MLGAAIGAPPVAPFATCRIGSGLFHAWSNRELPSSVTPTVGSTTPGRSGQMAAIAAPFYRAGAAWTTLLAVPAMGEQAEYYARLFGWEPRAHRRGFTGSAAILLDGALAAVIGYTPADAQDALRRRHDRQPRATADRRRPARLSAQMGGLERHHRGRHAEREHPGPCRRHAHRETRPRRLPRRADGDRMIIRGDAITLPIADASVDAIATDPPYGLGFMGREWDRFQPLFFQEWCEQWGREALRVLRPGGHMVAFGGTRTYHRMVSGLEDAGVEVRDSIGYLGWIYGSGFPKSLNIEKVTGDPAWGGFGTALKPAWEPIALVRRPLAGTVAVNVQVHGTGALNIDASRIGSGDGGERHGEPMRHDRRGRPAARRAVRRLGHRAAVRGDRARAHRPSAGETGNAANGDVLMTDQLVPRRRLL